MKKISIGIAILSMLTARGISYGEELVSPTDSIATTALTEIVPEAKVDPNYDLGHFTWGADLGSSVDLTANDMTSVDLHAYFGYKDSWLRFLGAGVGVNSMISNQSRCYPIYAMVRTSFSNKPQLCFFDARVGFAFNNIMSYKSQTDFYGSIGIGITLAKGRKFSSHIILSYTYMPLQPFYSAREVVLSNTSGESFEGDAPAQTITVYDQIHVPDMHFASIRIGCSF
jgi:hypothetical protein